MYNVVYSTLGSIKLSTVYNMVLFIIYMNHEMGCSPGKKSAQPATLTSGFSLLYSTVYSVQYSVHCIVQSNIGVWGIQVLSGM